jgi:hypothetical protein
LAGLRAAVHRRSDLTHRSSDLTGGLLIACGVGCLAAAVAFADEGPRGLFARSPLSLAIWGCLLVGWGAYRIIKPRAGGPRALAGAVRMLRPLAGRPEGEIRKWLGAPHAAADAGDGSRDLTWDAPDYSVTLRFRGGVCQSVVQEVARER